MMTTLSGFNRSGSLTASLRKEILENWPHKFVSLWGCKFSAPSSDNDLTGWCYDNSHPHPHPPILPQTTLPESINSLRLFPRIVWTTFNRFFFTCFVQRICKGVSWNATCSSSWKWDLLWRTSWINPTVALLKT